MRLLRLELSGFKSFSDKISVSFVQDGVSIIVGPNGCGKSNIVDAIRWVLGEQSAKHLRGASMEDVIFNGSETRPPVNMAQVTLYFSNPQHDTIEKYSEFSEISVSRKLFRSGESSYLINKTPCRLSDIRELFMDTGIGGKGYSIIEQGRIDQIVTAKPQDRRNIIDEAAGIVKFKAKRNDAERKFSQSRDNLTRVQDIIGELETQEVTLEKQVKEAERFLEAKGRYERLSQGLNAFRWKNLRDQAMGMQEEREEVHKSVEILKAKTAGFEARKESLELEIARKRQSLDELREVLGRHSKEAIQLESKLESDKRALADLDEWEKKGGMEKEELDERILSLEEQLESVAFDLDELADQIEAVKEERAEVAEEMEAQSSVIAEREAQLAALKKEELDLKSGKSGESEQLLQLRERSEEALTRQTQSKDHLNALDLKLKEREAALEQLDRDLRGKKEAKEKAQDRLTTVKAQIANLEEEYEELDFRINEISKLQNQTESRLISIEEFLEGHEDFDQGTKSLLDHFAQNPTEARNLGFIGTLVDLIKPSERLCEQVKAFVGRHFNLLVFKENKNLAKIQELLTRLESPYLEFCFLDLRPGETDLLGSVNRMIEWEKESLHLAEQFSNLSHGLEITDPAQLAGPHGLIDPMGRILTKEKIFCMGHKSTESRGAAILERRRELVELRGKLEALNQQIVVLEEQEFAKKEQLEEMDNLLERTQEEAVQAELDKVSLDKEINQTHEELKRIRQEKENALVQTAEAKAQHERFLERIKELEEGLSSKQDRVEKLHQELEKVEGQLEEARLRKEIIQGKDQEKEVRLAGLSEKRENFIQLQARIKEDILSTQTKKKEMTEHHLQTKERRERLNKELEAGQEKLPQLLERLRELDRSQKSLADEIEEKVKESAEFQKSMAQEVKEIQELTERQHAIDIKLAQFAQEAKNLEENLFDDWGLRPDEVLESFAEDEDFDKEEAEKEVKRLKRIVDSVEGINLAAKQEYETLMERLTFLRKESQDLIDSIETLEQSIDEIDQESKKRFRDTFKKVNENFIDLFPKLFGGGSAHLRLTDPDDLLATGVEIIAQPPGKKLQNMTLLSGGEKAMTAIAMIFAIFQMKPSPFCLLDEVDAPLDDANNGRFNEHVKAMTENSQFVIITHNKKTMEIGDAMFGVTMEEPGTSKIVSVDFREAEKNYLHSA